MLHRRGDCSRADLWPNVPTLEGDDQHGECLEGFGNSSVYFGESRSSFVGDPRTFMHTMYEEDVYDGNGNLLEIYFEVSQIFFCPFCGQAL